MTTTPYAEVQYTDQPFTYKGKPYEFDEEHSYTYFIPNEIAKAKYAELILLEIIFPFRQNDFLDDIEDWAPGGYYDDPETYQDYLNQIPWREKHFTFYFSHAYCTEDMEGDEWFLDDNAIARWAGLDPNDLIHEVPILEVEQ